MQGCWNPKLGGHFPRNSKLVTARCRSSFPVRMQLGRGRPGPQVSFGLRLQKVCVFPPSALVPLLPLPSWLTGRATAQHTWTTWRRTQRGKASANSAELVRWREATQVYISLWLGR